MVGHRSSLGVGIVAVAAIVEQIGAHAFPSPLLATASAAYVLREAPAEGAATATLGRIAEGAIVALACFDTRGDLDLGRSDLVAMKSGDGYVLDGQVAEVQDGDKADSFVVLARGADGTVIAVVPKDATGLTITSDRIVDLTRGQVRLAFDKTSITAAEVVAAGSAATTAVARALPALLTLVSADLVGVCEWQLRTTAESAKVREQFGKQIGSYQAIRHPLVDMMIGIDQARSLTYAAASAYDHGGERTELLARMAKAKASDVGRFCSSRSVQFHGGIGFTWECDVHLFFEGSEHDQVLFGDGAQQRQRITALLGGAGTMAERRHPT